MTYLNDDDVEEASAEQLAALRELGVSEFELEGLNSDDAAEWIAELQAMRENAGRIGHE